MRRTIQPFVRAMQHKPLVLFLSCALVFLWLHEFFPPATPVLAAADQAIFLQDAWRMLQSQVLYRDFFEFTTPGTPAIYFGLFRLFAPRAWVPDAMIVLLGLGLSWLGVIISRNLIIGPCAFLPSILFLLIPYRSVLDATHHWYSMLFEMVALAVLISSRTNMRSAVAGTLCGVAAFFTQSQGLLTVLGVGLFLLWEQHHKRESATWLLRREGALLATFSIAVAALNAYFVSKAGLGRFLYCTVVFPFKYYPSQPHNSWRAPLMELPHFNSWLSLPGTVARLFLIAALPAIYLLFFFWLRRRTEGPSSSSLVRDRLMLVR